MPETRDYFNTDRVPHPVKIAASVAIQVIGDHINAFPDVQGHGGEGRMQRAHAEHADGFWSWNNGGFIFDAKGRISIASQYETCPGAVRWLVDQYDAGHIEGMSRLGHDGEPLTGDYDDEDIDRDWLDGTYTYEVRIFARGKDEFRNETGEDEMILTVGVNPYDPGESGAWTYYLIDRVIAFSEITADKIDDFAEEAKKALDADRTRAGAAAFQVFKEKRRTEKAARGGW